MCRKQLLTLICFQQIWKGKERSYWLRPTSWGRSALVENQSLTDRLAVEATEDRVARRRSWARLLQRLTDTLTPPPCQSFTSLLSLCLLARIAKASCRLESCCTLDTLQVNTLCTFCPRSPHNCVTLSLSPSFVVMQRIFEHHMAFIRDSHYWLPNTYNHQNREPNFKWIDEKQKGTCIITGRYVL